MISRIHSFLFRFCLFFSLQGKGQRGAATTPFGFATTATIPGGSTNHVHKLDYRYLIPTPYSVFLNGMELFD